MKPEKIKAIYKNLYTQIDKIRRHNRQGSFQSKNRYFAATKVFCKFLATDFALEKFANIKDKHIEAYVKDMQARGLAASTIKTNLAAIRFYHDFSDSKNTISGNEKFNLEKRHFGGTNRSWKDTEFKAYLTLCTERGRERDKCIATLGRHDALRIHEACRLDRNDAEKAIATNVLTVKGKGGKIRSIPLSAESKQALIEYIPGIGRGEKLFVKSNEKTHLIIKQVQNFINRNRNKYQDPSHVGVSLTYHGLRHTRAAELYASCVRSGMSDLDARRHVSDYLGHGRDDVTRIYLAK